MNETNLELLVSAVNKGAQLYASHIAGQIIASSGRNYLPFALVVEAKPIDYRALGPDKYTWIGTIAWTLSIEKVSHKYKSLDIPAVLPAGTIVERLRPHIEDLVGLYMGRYRARQP